MLDGLIKSSRRKKVVDRDRVCEKNMPDYKLAPIRVLIYFFVKKINI